MTKEERFLDDYVGKMMYPTMLEKAKAALHKLIEEAIAEHEVKQEVYYGKALRYKNGGDWLASIHGTLVECDIPQIEPEDTTIEDYGDLEDVEAELIDVKIIILPAPYQPEEGGEG